LFAPVLQLLTAFACKLFSQQKSATLHVFNVICLLERLAHLRNPHSQQLLNLKGSSKPGWLIIANKFLRVHFLQFISPLQYNHVCLHGDVKLVHLSHPNFDSVLHFRVDAFPGSLKCFLDLSLSHGCIPNFVFIV
jgi:hypothetical protein